MSAFWRAVRPSSIDALSDFSARSIRRAWMLQRAKATPNTQTPSPARRSGVQNPQKPRRHVDAGGGRTANRGPRRAPRRPRDGNEGRRRQARGRGERVRPGAGLLATALRAADPHGSRVFALCRRLGFGLLLDLLRARRRRIGIARQNEQRHSALAADDPLMRLLPQAGVTDVALADQLKRLRLGRSLGGAKSEPSGHAGGRVEWTVRGDVRGGDGVRGLSTRNGRGSTRRDRVRAMEWENVAGVDVLHDLPQLEVRPSRTFSVA